MLQGLVIKRILPYILNILLILGVGCWIYNSTRLDMSTESNIERVVGRMEGQLDAIAITLIEVQRTLREADEWRHFVKRELADNREHADKMSAVAEAFNALQRSIQDGTLATRSVARGVVIGVGLAGGAIGAAGVSGFKWVWTLILGG